MITDRTGFHSVLSVLYEFHFAFTLNNGNRTSCRPIRSVIIRVINKIGRPSSGESDLLLIITITISEKTNALFLCERAFNINYPKLGKITGRETA